MRSQDREDLGQPWRIFLDMFLKILFKLSNTYPFVILNFVRIRINPSCVAAKKYVIEFPLCQPTVEGKLILDRPDFYQRGGKTELFLKPQPGTPEKRYSRLRMTTTTVCPEPRTVIFAARPSLQKQAVPVVKDKDGKRPVQLSCA
jgi:hypothetical protein